MGEIAEMILNGELCEGCGMYMDGAQGFVRRCGSCARTWNDPHHNDRVPCPTCGKSVKFAGLRDHQKDVHGVTKNWKPKP